jgi:hypothetical protein
MNCFTRKGIQPKNKKNPESKTKFIKKSGILHEETSTKIKKIIKI